MYDWCKITKEDSLKKGKSTSKTSLRLDNRSLKRVDVGREILGTVISSNQKNQVLSKIWLSRKEMLHVATVNPEFVMEARINLTFKNILAQCLTVADGHGIVWADKILNRHDTNTPLPRISGSWLVGEILKHANERGEKVFLLGGAHGVAEQAAKEMNKQYPLLHISWYSGAQTVKVEKSEEASMTIAKINSVEPDYLLVAYGSPWQDIWIEENRQYLRVRVAMGVGGVFDEWAGRIRMSPDWVDAMGMKWLWRLVHEPRRWRRVMRVFHFGLLVLYHKLID